MGLSVTHLSPLGSQVSFTHATVTRIESVVDWEAIAKKYRALVGDTDTESGSIKETENENNASSVDIQGQPPPPVGAGQVIGNNVANAVGGQHAV